jgi:hypothetical protein
MRTIKEEGKMGEVSTNLEKIPLPPLLNFEDCPQLAEGKLPP